MPSSAAVPPQRAMRLIFEYDGDQVRLVSQQPVDLPVDDVGVAMPEHAGYYVDTRAGDGRTLTRAAAPHAFSGSAEVFPERAGEPISRIDVEKPRGAFTVVVAAPEAADHVSVVRVAPPPTAGARAAAESAPRVTDLATFPLNK